jgi:hypothetical protein
MRNHIRAEGGRVVHHQEESQGREASAHQKSPWRVLTGDIYWALPFESISVLETLRVWSLDISCRWKLLGLLEFVDWGGGFLLSILSSIHLDDT